MEITLRKNLVVVLFFALAVVRSRGEEEGNAAISAQGQNNVASTNVEEINKTSNEVVVENNKGRNNGGGGGGGGVGWGWGGGGGGGNKNGGWGWGGGGGGGTSWRWGCNSNNPTGKRGHKLQRKRDFAVEDFKKGEFAQCVVKGRCNGMRLDCPLHCGGPCFYDCRHMCKAHCKR